VIDHFAMATIVRPSGVRLPDQQHELQLPFELPRLKKPCFEFHNEVVEVDTTNPTGQHSVLSSGPHHSRFATSLLAGVAV
jgi:hypothetical protein